MAVPERWRPTWPSAAEIERFSELCDQIERREKGWEDDLAIWNRRASREYREVEFRTYYGSTDKETFVTEALLPSPTLDPSVTFGELVEVVRAVAELADENGELDEAEQGHLLDALDVNLPGASISDLIYWPNHWFGDGSANPNALELTHAQVVRYALLRSGRVVPGCPTEPVLPFSMPGGTSSTSTCPTDGND